MNQFHLLNNENYISSEIGLNEIDPTEICINGIGQVQKIKETPQQFRSLVQVEIVSHIDLSE